ncbi:MAG: hypothetical protein WAS27_00565, partial [Candidatus Saccharimonadales bacterium]
MDHKKKVAAFGLIPLLIALLVGVVFHQYGATPLARAACDVSTLRYYAEAARAQGNEAEARYRDQEADACENTPAPLAAPSSTEKKEAPKEWKAFYYANEPLASPEWQNSFAGNPIARHPKFKGKAMEELTAEEGLLESEYRRGNDPMLAVTEAQQFAVLPRLDENAQRAEIVRLAGNKAELDRLNVKTSRVKRDDYTSKVVTLPAGLWCSTFSYGGEVPLVVIDCNVNRTTSFAAMEFTKKSDGSVTHQRLACGFQEYWQNEVAIGHAPLVPQPSPGFGRTEEGVPTPPTGGGPGTSTPKTPGTTPPTTPPTTP